MIPFKEQWLQQNDPGCSEEQKAAILCDAPHTVCVAGPGSGKTRTLVRRIQCLVASGVDPSKIVAITFTNNAAGEMQHRLGGIKLNYLGTLHGYCLRLLEQHGSSLGYGSKITVLEPTDVNAIMAETAKRLGVKTPVHKLLSQRENEGVKQLPKTKQEICIASFARRLRQESAVDFNLILEDALRLLRLPNNVPEIEHLLVDEFQDSGSMDEWIYRSLPAKSRFYSGDPDQSIMSFRGGKMENILELCQQEWVNVVKLEGNYRSLPVICESAQMLIEHNQKRIAKQTIAKRVGEGSVEVVSSSTEAEECVWIARQCREWLDAGVPASEIAVLARNNSTLKSVRAELKTAGLPLVEKQVPKDNNRFLRIVLEMLRNPHSDLAVFRYLEAMEGPEKAEDVRRQSRRDQKLLRDYVPESRYAKADGVELWNGDLLNVLVRLGLRQDARDTVREAMDKVPSCDLGALILALQAPEAEEATDGITVTTFHSSKGCEWENVIIASAEQDVMLKANSDPDEVEEARRLFYVAMTRAKNVLKISYCNYRMENWGRRDVVASRPCQFIRESGL